MTDSTSIFGADLADLVSLVLTVVSWITSGTVRARGSIGSSRILDSVIREGGNSDARSTMGLARVVSGANLRLAKSACILSTPAPVSGTLDVKTSSNGSGAGTGGETIVDGCRFLLDSRSIKIGDSGRGTRAGERGDSLRSI